MSERLLLCVDLDRTLLPNGPEPESAGAREHFKLLVSRPEVTLVLVTGRDRELVDQAIEEYHLPLPDFVIGDVGTTLYAIRSQQRWEPLDEWQREIAQDWLGLTSRDLCDQLHDYHGLRLQERTKQNTFKLSYYTSPDCAREYLSALIQARLLPGGIKARLVWSIDEPAGVGLLDVIPARASKLHALEALLRLRGFAAEETVFCGDSGNDLEVLESQLPSVLVANATAEVRQQAWARAAEQGHVGQLYLAHGGFMGMNGCYAAGILEGVAYFRPMVIPWMGFGEGQTAP